MSIIVKKKVMATVGRLTCFEICYALRTKFFKKSSKKGGFLGLCPLHMLHSSSESVTESTD